MKDRRLPRNKVSTIVWLAEPGLEYTPPSFDYGSPDDLYFQLTLRSGARITLKPEQLDEGRLAGMSPLLGECWAEVTSINSIRFGSEIVSASADVDYQGWRMIPAPDPAYIDDENAGGDAGTQSSALVGLPAPEIRLDRLDGEKFDLSELKGKIVILDFWATWCGPCVQWLPQLEQIVASDENVGEIVAVNMEEDKETIQSLLDRLDLELNVVLDRDGVAAGRYQVRAIPQTVVIDKEGIVRRVYLGGGKKVADDLRNYLREAD